MGRAETSWDSMRSKSICEKQAHLKSVQKKRKCRAGLLGITVWWKRQTHIQERRAEEAVNDAL